MPFPHDPAGRHRAIADIFTDRVRGVSDWDAPAPVEGWVARDVVRHLVEWFPAFLKGGAGIELPQGPTVDEDPVGAWTAHAGAVQALLDDPGTGTRTLSNPHIGDVPLAEAIDRFYTSDVLMHTWDLARATGQDDTLDLAAVSKAHAFLTPMGDAMRRPGGFGPEKPIEADASAQDRLLAFAGRQP
jgi:uncharacterized protein (TIGR03086 family)